mmetsp:Transcript_68798/g.152232  ORF Transcript_68798/g.152232 Transcript_68798/m.152232 type:complete len:314 (+) Transcript_68798:61-1002(+)|eukprot:CAMPEP_0180629654 /NCGR_PEP_ID=MMETSP1037_2-20121125/39574_1 /TAXON_ID=632150 /ORGANISM="Azadinium spinosum, Strain 3D9" /LENGTH=313 /DNA_ID=CAMNT_0022650465 /DNA_START=63 /DNA_END=1004 /DNA_ORIENTATION=+
MLTSLLFTLTHPLTTISWIIASYAADKYYPDGHAQLLNFTLSSSHTVTSVLVKGRRMYGEEEDWEEDGEAAQTVGFITMIVFILVPLGIWLAYTVQYKNTITNNRAPFTGGGQPQLDMLTPNTICNCSSDMHLCLHSFCCTDSRAADTFQTAGLASFWTVVVAFFMEYLAANIIDHVFFEYILAEVMAVDAQSRNGPGWIIASFIIAAYLTMLRSGYRSKFGGQPTQPMDFLCYWCCPLCSIAQDGAALDSAQQVHVECCCSLVKFGGGAQQMSPGGQPVTVGQPVVGAVVGVVQPNTAKPVMAQVVTPANTA